MSVDFAALRTRLETEPKRTLVEGDTWYLVSAHWWRLCRDSVARGVQPPAIDNQDLVDEASTSATVTVLRRGLVVDADYKLIPDRLWFTVHDLVGGGPMIERRAIALDEYGTEIKVEVFRPVILAHLDVPAPQEGPAPLRIEVSSVDRVEDLKDELVNAFFPEEGESIGERFGLERPFDSELEARLRVREPSSQKWELLPARMGRDRVDAMGWNEDGQEIALDVKRPDGTWASGLPDAEGAADTYAFAGGGGGGGGGAHGGSGEAAAGEGEGVGMSREEALALLRSRWSRETPAGVVGLRNLGNTCFMNSALQCLSKTELLTQYFLERHHRAELNPDNVLGHKGRLAKAYSSFLRDLWKPLAGGSSIAPSRLKVRIGQFAPQFRGYSQHDSQELLAFLLDGLHEDLNRVLHKPATTKPEGDDSQNDAALAAESWELHLKRNQSVIVDLFQGQLKSRLECPTCHRVSVTFDPFMYLSVPVPNEDTEMAHIALVRAAAVRRDALAGTCGAHDGGGGSSGGEVALPHPLQRTTYAAKIAKNGTAKTIKVAFSAVTGVPVERLALIEVWNGKPFTIFSDDRDLGRYVRSDSLLLLELPERAARKLAEERDPWRRRNKRGVAAAASAAKKLRTDGSDASSDSAKAEAEAKVEAEVEAKVESTDASVPPPVVFCVVNLRSHRRWRDPRLISEGQTGYVDIDEVEEPEEGDEEEVAAAAVVADEPAEAADASEPVASEAKDGEADGSGGETAAGDDGLDAETRAAIAAAVAEEEAAAMSDADALASIFSTEAAAVAENALARARRLMADTAGEFKDAGAAGDSEDPTATTATGSASADDDGGSGGSGDGGKPRVTFGPGGGSSTKRSYAAVAGASSGSAAASASSSSRTSGAAMKTRPPGVYARVFGFPIFTSVDPTPVPEAERTTPASANPATTALALTESPDAFAESADKDDVDAANEDEFREPATVPPNSFVTHKAVYEAVWKVVRHALVPAPRPTSWTSSSSSSSSYPSSAGAPVDPVTGELEVQEGGAADGAAASAAAASTPAMVMPPSWVDASSVELPARMPFRLVLTGDMISYDTIRMLPLNESRFAGLKSRDNLYIQWHPDVCDVVEANLEREEETEQSRRARSAASTESATLPLDWCLRHFCEREVLGENDKWFCSRCQDFVQASKEMTPWRLPNVLIIHLKRFSYSDEYRDRIDTLINFPLEGLDLKPYLGAGAESAADQETVYDLFAVSNHMGGMGGGHYTAYAKSPIGGKWYNFDDSFVAEERDPSSIVSSAAYVLFYRRRNADVYVPPAVLAAEGKTAKGDAEGDGSGAATGGGAVEAAAVEATKEGEAATEATKEAEASAAAAAAAAPAAAPVARGEVVSRAVAAERFPDLGVESAVLRKFLSAHAAEEAEADNDGEVEQGHDSAVDRYSAESVLGMLFGMIGATGPTYVPRGALGARVRRARDDEDEDEDEDGDGGKDGGDDDDDDAPVPPGGLGIWDIDESPAPASSRGGADADADAGEDASGTEPLLGQQSDDAGGQDPRAGYQPIGDENL